MTRERNSSPKCFCPRFFTHPRVMDVCTFGSWMSARKCLFSKVYRGPKKHINFFNINFLAPDQSTPFLDPRKKFMCLSFPGKERKKGTHININIFRGIFGVKNREPLARRRQLRASSGGSSDATSEASFPLHNTEARQQQGNLDVTSDVVLSCCCCCCCYCCCCPSAGAEKRGPKRPFSATNNLVYCFFPCPYFRGPARSF